jgi:uncharacterized protein (DUF433 family)
MTPTVLTVPVALHRQEDGTIRVANTRVTLDIVVAAFQEGATPEEIAQNYSVLKLADVYAVIAYFLHNRNDIETYLQERKARAAELRREIEARWPHHDLRERLLARQMQ